MQKTLIVFIFIVQEKKKKEKSNKNTEILILLCYCFKSMIHLNQHKEEKLIKKISTFTDLDTFSGCSLLNTSG